MHLSQDTKLATESNPIFRVAMLYVVTHALHITGLAAPSIVESFFELSAGAELHYRRTTFRPSCRPSACRAMATTKVRSCVLRALVCRAAVRLLSALSGHSQVEAMWQSGISRNRTLPNTVDLWFMVGGRFAKSEPMCWRGFSPVRCEFNR